MNPFFLLGQQNKVSQPNYETPQQPQFQPYNQPNNQYIPDQFNQIHQNIGQLFAQQTNMQPSYQSYQPSPYGQPNMQPPFGQPYGQPYGQANNYGYGEEVTYGQQGFYGQQNFNQKPEQFQQFQPKPREQPQAYNKPEKPIKKTIETDIVDDQYHNSIKPELIQQILSHKNQNISAQLVQKHEKKQIYPQLQQYKPPNKQVGSQVQYLGWSEEKTVNDMKNDKLGETKYVMQIGRSNNMDNTFNKNVGKALFNWLSNDEPNKIELKQKSPYAQWDQMPQNRGKEGIDQYLQMQQENRNKSVWDELNFRNISFELNPIFSQGIIPPKFPSPFIKYKIIPYLDEKKVLDVTSTNDWINGYKKNNLIIYDYHGGPNQLFYIKQAYPEVYYIMNLARGYVVRLPNPDAKQDAPTYANPRSQNFIQNAQLWRLVPCENSYLIQSVGKPGYVLDLNRQKSCNGTHVIVWKKQSKDNQKWAIYPS